MLLLTVIKSEFFSWRHFIHKSILHRVTTRSVATRFETQSLLCCVLCVAFCRFLRFHIHCAVAVFSRYTSSWVTQQHKLCVFVLATKCGHALKFCSHCNSHSWNLMNEFCFSAIGEIFSPFPEKLFIHNFSCRSMAAHKWACIKLSWGKHTIKNHWGKFNDVNLKVQFQS